MRKFLIVVDMQNDFITGSLGSEKAQSIVPNVVKKIQEYKEQFNGRTVNIIATRDTHFTNYLNTQEGIRLPIEHCIKDTEGWELCDEVTNALSGLVSLHDKYSFGDIRLAKEMESLNYKASIESIELVGLCTDICVVSNALILKAMLPEVKIIVDANCCAGVTPDNHVAALKTMKACQIEVINE